jgi:hypothetical protein
MAASDTVETGVGPLSLPAAAEEGFHTLRGRAPPPPPPPPPPLLRIRNPEKGFAEVVDECIADGTYHAALKRLRKLMIEAETNKDLMRVSFLNRAFKVFLDKRPHTNHLSSDGGAI